MHQVRKITKIGAYTTEVVAEWVTGEELIQRLGLKSRESLRTIREQHPTFCKAIGNNRNWIYNISGIIGG